MIKESIMEAQYYLTMEKIDGSKSQIINLENLLNRHSMNKVIRFLKDYSKEKEKALKNMILIDKTHPKVDQYIAALFRMAMAIQTLEEGEEVAIIERSKPRTKKSGKFYKRNSGCHSGSRKRQDINYDGEDRVSRYPSQRAA